MLVFTRSRHTCTKCRKVILAAQTAQTVDSIQPLSISAGPSRTYVNMVVNVLCVSLHPRTHGEGEGLTASSPAEPAGRRQDPMGHLPFGRNTLMERILGVMRTFLEIRHSFPLGTIPAQA